MRGQIRRAEDQAIPNPGVTFRLLTPHVDYLEALADRDGLSLSRVFGSIVAKYGTQALSETRRLAKPSPVKLVVLVPHLAVLDRLAGTKGLSRSDIARRLIDDARGDDW